MDDQLKERLDGLEARVNAIFISVEKTRKYFLLTVIITVVAVVLPLIGLAIAIPSVISSYSSQLDVLQ